MTIGTGGADTYYKLPAFNISFRYADRFDDDLDEVAERLDRLRAGSWGPAADFLRTERLPQPPAGAISKGKAAGQEPVEGVETRGIEPLTPALQRRCSAN